MKTIGILQHFKKQSSGGSINENEREPKNIWGKHI